MDLLKYYETAEAERNAAMAESTNVRLICPPVSIAEDASTSFATLTITGFADFLSLEGKRRVVGTIDVSDRAVARMVDMLSEYSDVVDVKVVVMTDVPGADYDFEFSKKTAKFESVSYVNVVESLIEEAARQKALELETNNTKHHAEIRAQTRADGSVGSFTAFDVPKTTDDVSVDDGEPDD